MSRVCENCGKHTVSGNRVSHAKNRTRRKWKPNLVSVKEEVNGTSRRRKICTRCLRTASKAKKD